MPLKPDLVIPLHDVSAGADAYILSTNFSFQKSIQTNSLEKQELETQ